MDDLQIYSTFISHRKANPPSPSEKIHNHHIVPTCMGGSNDPDNLIRLTVQDHFEAHRLLALENPDHIGCQQAFWLMSNQNGLEVDAEDYARAMKDHSERMSSLMRGENNPMYGLKRVDQSKRMTGEGNPLHGKTGEAHPNYGTHLTDETKKKLSERFSGERNPMYGKKHTEESKMKMEGENNHMFGLTGEKNPFYGRTHSEETIKKISGANHHMYGKNHSQSHKDKVSTTLLSSFPFEKYPEESDFHNLWEIADQIFELYKIGLPPSKILELVNSRKTSLEHNRLSIIIGRFRKGFTPLENKRWVSYSERRYTYRFS